jgi:8-oxo-dGTP pyrophosphatase MutT (NUDIX family)
MEIKDYIKQYRDNGGYINSIRQHIGHAPLITIGVGVIIENDRGEILLQQRKDNGKWGIIGGGMELGESFEDTIRREAREEAGIELGPLSLYTVINGPDRFIKYPNGDIVYSTSIVYKTNTFYGEIVSDPDEAYEHRFFKRDEIPENINDFDRAFIAMWAAGINKKLFITPECSATFM